MCCYILCIHHHADAMLEWLHKSFQLKPWFGKPDMYLGTKLCKTRLHNGLWAWEKSPDKYVWAAIRNCTVHVAANYSGKFRLPKKAENPFKMGYDPEFDTSPELDPNAASYGLTVIGILRWKIELGRIDRITEVLLLSSHVGLPRGHLDAAVHVMAHVGQRYNSRLVYEPEIDHSIFKNLIGKSSIGMPRWLYPWMVKNLEVRRLTSVFLWIVIMQRIS